MKKTFALHQARRDDDRVRDKIRAEINKYLRRERRKAFPEGFDRWDFDCRVGPEADTAAVTGVHELGLAIEAVASVGASAVYVEIIAVPANRPPQIVAAEADAVADAAGDLLHKKPRDTGGSAGL